MDSIKIRLPIENLGDSKDEIFENYNRLKTSLIKGFEIFTFEMKRNSKLFEIDVKIKNDENVLEKIYECLSKRFESTTGFVGSSIGFVGSSIGFVGSSFPCKNRIDESSKINDSNRIDESSKINDSNRIDESSKINDSNRIDKSSKINDSNKINTIHKTIKTLSPLKFILFKILHFKKLNKILQSHNCKISYSENNLRIDGIERSSVNICFRSIIDLFYSNALLETTGVFSYKEMPFIELIMNDKSKVIFGTLKSFSDLECTKNCVLDLIVPGDTGNFICGKKMGKIFKIDSSILQVIYIDENTIFKMAGLVKDCLKCYSQLFDEFPYEICFNIDRKLHKKIIGMDGCTIQRIMKKYNFYVKFLNSKEVDNLGLEGNVILKTPRKNKRILNEAKNEIFNISKDCKNNEDSTIKDDTVKDNTVIKDISINDNVKNEIFNLEGIAMIIEMCIKRKSK